MTPLCETNYQNDPVCGTDGKDYGNISSLECAQKKEYGKRVNLQFKHMRGCQIWEKIGIDTSELLFVSELRFHSIVCEKNSSFSITFPCRSCWFSSFFLVCVSASVELSEQHGEKRSCFQGHCLSESNDYVSIGKSLIVKVKCFNSD